MGSDNNGKARKLKDRGGQQKTVKEWREIHAKVLLSLNLLWRKGEGDDRIVIPLPICVQESSQPLHLRGEVHDDDLHLDIKMKLEDL